MLYASSVSSSPDFSLLWVDINRKQIGKVRHFSWKEVWGVFCCVVCCFFSTHPWFQSGVVWAIAQNSWFSILLVHLIQRKYHISSTGKYINTCVSVCIVHLHLCGCRLVNIMSFQDQGSGCWIQQNSVMEKELNIGKETDRCCGNPILTSVFCHGLASGL